MTDERQLSRMIQDKPPLFTPALAEIADEEKRELKKEQWRTSVLNTLKRVNR